MGLQNDIGKMIASLTGDSKPEEEVNKTVEEKKEEKETVVEEEDEKEETKEEEKVEVKIETKKEGIKDVKDTEQKDKGGEEKGTKEEPEEKQKDEVSKKADEVDTLLEIVEQDFLKGIDIYDLQSDPKSLNKVLNSVVARAVRESGTKVTEKVLLSIPEIVRANITVIRNLEKASEEFYDNNKDLKEFKKVVATVFEEVAAESPGKKIHELFDSVAKETRKRLGLKEAAVKESKAKADDPPSLPKKGASVKQKDEPSVDPLQAELEAMTKTIRR